MITHLRLTSAATLTAAVAGLAAASAGGLALASAHADTARPATHAAPAAHSAVKKAVKKAVKAALVDDRFMPTHVTVEAGGTVTWVWKGQSPHNVTITGPAKHHSPTQTTGTYKVRFTKVGTYHVVCTIHEAEGMKMTVTVVR